MNDIVGALTLIRAVPKNCGENFLSDGRNEVLDYMPIVIHCCAFLTLVVIQV